MSTTTPPNPWAILATQAHLRLRIEPLPDGYRGLTDGQTIWLSDRLSQRERRCTLMHELIHVERGHRGHQPAAVERSVREATARAMLPSLDAIRDAIAAHHPAEVADALWVTDDLLHTRLAALTPADRHYLAATTTT